MQKISVLFVCLGNICRSPLAEGVFKDYVKEKGQEDLFIIDSAGTSAYHSGELPDSRMRAAAKRRGYNLNSRSRQIRFEDFEKFDYIIAMDDSNVDNLKRLATTLQEANKISKITSWSDNVVIDYIPDPYYSGAEGFEQVIDLIETIVPEVYDKIKSQLDK